MLFDPVTRHSLEDGTVDVEDSPLQGIKCKVGKSSFETRIDVIRNSGAQNDHVARGNLHGTGRFELAQPQARRLAGNTGSNMA